MTAIPSAKQMFLDTFVPEHATTMKVLRAFPADKGEFKPHERSQSALTLANTFVIEQMLISMALTNTLELGGGFPKPPGDFTVTVDKFDSDYRGVVELINKTPESRFNEGTVKFFTAPGKVGDVPVIGFCWMLLCDQIHHRGQLSVYVRMAGGKVPSIYGPSADEPWM